MSTQDCLTIELFQKHRVLIRKLHHAIKACPRDLDQAAVSGSALGAISVTRRYDRQKANQMPSIRVGGPGDVDGLGGVLRGVSSGRK